MELFLFMLERVGLIIVFAFLMSRWRLFREKLFQEQGMKEKIWLIIIFSSLCIISSYTGIKIESGTIHPLNQMIHSTINAEEAIANTRLISVAIAGIFGGPLVGVCRYYCRYSSHHTRRFYSNSLWCFIDSCGLYYRWFK